ncbi:MarR family winged helix-turn-helix transcriptional regulator [Nonomuraea jabiensis]|uniref:MarR family winged helix-turn-helix transcriptional regulator n=1 Tax=Nonomuraea jabiensis TaxID=882448 RepID=UPI003D7202A7
MVIGGEGGTEIMSERDELLDRIERAEERLALVSLRDQSSSLLLRNLTVQQFQVLLIVWIEGPVPAHAIASALRVGANAVTGIIDRLVIRSLVQRKESAEDRRVRLISLSDQGRRLIDELTASARAQRRHLLERLPIDTLRQFHEVLGQITDAATVTDAAPRLAPPR